MDLSFLNNLLQGNNGLLILLALFLFKDQLLALFAPKPKPVDPVVVPPPAPVVVPVTPEERPLVDALVKLLPIILPVIIDQISKQKADAK